MTTAADTTPFLSLALLCAQVPNTFWLLVPLIHAHCLSPYWLIIAEVPMVLTIMWDRGKRGDNILMVPLLLISPFSYLWFALLLAQVSTTNIFLVLLTPYYGPICSCGGRRYVSLALKQSPQVAKGISVWLDVLLALLVGRPDMGRGGWDDKWVDWDVYRWKGQEMGGLSPVARNHILLHHQASQLHPCSNCCWRALGTIDTYFWVMELLYPYLKESFAIAFP